MNKLKKTNCENSTKQPQEESALCQVETDVELSRKAAEFLINYRYFTCLNYTSLLELECPVTIN